MRINLDGTNKFIIWGTGHYSIEVVKYLGYVKSVFCHFDYVIDAFIDKDIKKHSASFCGIKVCPPSYIDNIDDQIIIISMLGFHETERLLISKGITNYITSFDLLHDELLVMKLINTTEVVSEMDVSPILFRNRFRNRIRKGNASVLNKDQEIPFIFRLSAIMSEYGDDFGEVDKYIVSDDTTSKKQNNFYGKVVGIYYRRLYSGGVERVISKLIPLLLEKGFCIVLFTHSVNEMDYDLPKDIERCVIPYDPLMPYLWLEQFYEELIKRNISVLINHAHAAWRSYYLGICAKKLDIRYLVESHTSKAAIESKNINYYEKIYALSDTLVVLSRTDREYWLKRGISAKYIPNPLALPNVNVEHNYNRKGMLWVGRIDDEEKNVYDIVRITQSISNIIPDIRLYVVGSADNESVLLELRRRISSSGLEDNIKIEGYQKDVHEFYVNAGVMICTSPYEGFPMAIAEGMSYGVPIVMYDIEGLELTRDKRGVVCVPQGDYEAFAESVVKILEDDMLRKRLSLEARQVIEKFTRIDIAEMWKKIIDG